MSQPLRIGIDLGGTKIAGVALDAAGDSVCRHRIATPHGDYQATVDAVVALAGRLAGEAGARLVDCRVGIGIPGSLSPATGLARNANSTWLNGRPFGRDLEAAFGQPLRIANDANCFAVSEAADGAAAGATSVFGVIIGTGCGGGLVIDGKPHLGRNAIGGEWGHNPLPWPGLEEYPGPECWCGRFGCIEAWVAGPALARDHAEHEGIAMDPPDIAMLAAAGDGGCRETLKRHAGRLARGLAHVVNIFDPDVIVLGGGLSNMAHLYTDLAPLIARHVFSDHFATAILPARHGATSGVRGAARLWDDTPVS